MKFLKLRKKNVCIKEDLFMIIYSLPLTQLTPKNVKIPKINKFYIILYSLFLSSRTVIPIYESNRINHFRHTTDRNKFLMSFSFFFSSTICPSSPVCRQDFRSNSFRLDLIFTNFPLIRKIYLFFENYYFYVSFIFTYCRNMTSTG